MCVQSLTLWAEATRYRLQERRRRPVPPAEPAQPAQAAAPAEPPQPAQAAVISSDLDTEPAGQRAKIATDHESGELIGAMQGSPG